MTNFKRFTYSGDQIAINPEHVIAVRFGMETYTILLVGAVAGENGQTVEHTIVVDGGFETTMATLAAS